MDGIFHFQLVNVLLMEKICKVSGDIGIGSSEIRNLSKACDTEVTYLILQSELRELVYAVTNSLFPFSSVTVVSQTHDEDYTLY